MLKDVRRKRHATVDDWPDLPLPQSPRARWRIAAALILLALLGVLVHFMSVFAGWR